MRLVVREPRFMGLTTEGERVVVWAHQIIADYESLRQDIEGFREGLKGVLRLGVIPAAQPVVARLTARFTRKHPYVSVDVRSMTSVDIQRAIDTFEVDAGLTYLDNEPVQNVRRQLLYRERYLFVTSKDAPLAGASAIKWRDAANANLCLLSEDMQNRRVLNNLAQSIGLKLQPRVTSNSFLAICSHVCSGEWSSIVPHTFSYIFSGCENLALIDLVDPVHTQSIGLVASDRDPLPPLARALMASAACLDVSSARGHDVPLPV